MTIRLAPMFIWLTTRHSELLAVSDLNGVRILFVSTAPKPAPQSRPRPSRKPVYPREVTGLVLIGILVLILTIIRYWQTISWNLR